MNETSVTQNFWQVPLPDLVLGEGEVHVWTADLDQQTVLDFEQILSTDEMAKANRFKFDEDRRRFICGRGNLRIILSKYLAITPDVLDFTYSQYGKPFLSDKFQRLNFNVSHSVDTALYVFCIDHEVGIDIEKIKPDFVDDELLAVCFTEHEKTQFHSLAKSDQDLFFYSCWTKKEAYLKATGFGLTVSPNEIETSELPAFNTFLPKLPVVDGYATALAVRHQNLPLKFWRAA